MSDRVLPRENRDFEGRQPECHKLDLLHFEIVRIANSEEPTVAPQVSCKYESKLSKKSRSNHLKAFKVLLQPSIHDDRLGILSLTLMDQDQAVPFLSSNQYFLSS